MVPKTSLSFPPALYFVDATCAQVQRLPVSKLGVGKTRAGEETAAIELQRSSAGDRAVICLLKGAQKNKKKKKRQACMHLASRSATSSYGS